MAHVGNQPRCGSCNVLRGLIRCYRRANVRTLFAFSIRDVVYYTIFVGDELNLHSKAVEDKQTWFIPDLRQKWSAIDHVALFLLMRFY
jgi:hypothetical protein